VARAAVLAVGAAATADQVGLCSVQCRAIRLDPHYAGGDYYGSGAAPVAGMALARGVGQITYRTGTEFDERFGRSPQGDEDPLTGGRFAVESYLEYQGEKLAARFDPNSYVVLSEAMNSHDVGRGRGGVAAALSRVTAEVRLQAELAGLLPGDHALTVIRSRFGHDGFLLEWEQAGALVARAIGT
jgi:homoserine O-acetyltransferase